MCASMIYAQSSYAWSMWYVHSTRDAVKRITLIQDGEDMDTDEED